MSDRMPENHILQAALAIYGPDMQKIVAIEELSELQKELCKSLRCADNVGRIAEEIADVQIMLDQMVMLFGCSEETKKWRADKIERLKIRMAAAPSV